MIKHFYLTHREDPNRYYHFEDLGVMVMKRYSTIPRASGLKLHNHDLGSYPGHSLGLITLLQRSRRHILQPKPTGLGYLMPNPVSLGDSTPQTSSYTATNHPSRKLSKLDEPDTRDTGGEVGTSS